MSHFGEEDDTPEPEATVASSAQAVELPLKVGSRVRYTATGAKCVVQAVKEGGLYSLVTDDGKHAFDAKEGDLVLLDKK